MAGYEDLSEFEHGVIVSARELGHSISKVAMKFGFSRTTISRVYHEYRESAGSSTSVTLRNIQRNILDMGFQSRRPTRVPLLTARYKALRLAWAHQYRHWIVDDWKHVAWYDESRFQWNPADGRFRVCRQPHESMDPTCQQGTFQASGGSVMVWGVCSWRDMGPLMCLDTTLTGDRNVSILSDHLHLFMFIMHSDGLGELQQDNATPHTSRIATQWPQEHVSEFKHFR
ncbi:transposable element Tcb2 transposase [Trichonephila clavipes]|nr:transposable element Tcb2 transposase [Trichonephila clavipes]